MNSQTLTHLLIIVLPDCVVPSNWRTYINNCRTPPSTLCSNIFLVEDIELALKKIRSKDTAGIGFQISLFVNVTLSLHYSLLSSLIRLYEILLFISKLFHNISRSTSRYNYFFYSNASNANISKYSKLMRICSSANSVCNVIGLFTCLENLFFFNCILC